MTDNNTNISVADILDFIKQLDPIDSSDINSYNRRLNICIDYCRINGIPILNRVVYLFLELTEKDINDMLSNNYGIAPNLSPIGVSGLDYNIIEPPDWRRFAERVNAICAASRELLMVNGDIGQLVGIFWQKAYDNMTDAPKQLSIPLTVNIPLTQAELLAQFGSNAGTDPDVLTAPDDPVKHHE